MPALEFRGELGFATAGYRGFAITRATVRNTEGKLISLNCVAFFTDFSIKDEVKAFCKKRGGNWEPASRFWYAPIETASISAALQIIHEFREEISSSLYMVCSGYGNEKVAQSLEKAISKTRLTLIESKPENTEPPVQNVQWVSEADEVEGRGDEGCYQGEMHFPDRTFPQLVELHKALPFDAPKRIKDGMGSEYREVFDIENNRWYAEPANNMTHHIYPIWDDLEYSEAEDKFVKIK